MPYCEIAAEAEVGLGNINYVMNGLKEMGFLIKLNWYIPFPQRRRFHQLEKTAYP